LIDSIAKSKVQPDLKIMNFAHTKYGFAWGGLTIERLASDDKTGWVVIALNTDKAKLQIYVSKSGIVRISENGAVVYEKKRKST
jgi:hypothetical protein